MLTFEKVLEIFKDYLALDTELEVCKSRYGYVRVEYDEIRACLKKGGDCAKATK